MKGAGGWKGRWVARWVVVGVRIGRGGLGETVSWIEPASQNSALNRLGQKRAVGGRCNPNCGCPP